MSPIVRELGLSRCIKCRTTITSTEGKHMEQAFVEFVDEVDLDPCCCVTVDHEELIEEVLEEALAEDEARMIYEYLFPHMRWNEAFPEDKDSLKKALEEINRVLAHALDHHEDISEELQFALSRNSDYRARITELEEEVTASETERTEISGKLIMEQCENDILLDELEMAREDYDAAFHIIGAVFGALVTPGFLDSERIDNVKTIIKNGVFEVTGMELVD